MGARGRPLGRERGPRPRCSAACASGVDAVGSSGRRRLRDDVPRDRRHDRPDRRRRLAPAPGAAPPRCSTRSPTRCELGVSLVTYFRGADAMRRRLVLLGVVLALSPRLRPSLASDFDPEDEFELHTWVSIHLGPLDLSINKAVVYLMLGAVAHDRARHRADARPARRCKPGTAADGRRDDLRDRAGADRRAGPADEGDRHAGSRTSRRCCSSSGSST